MIKQRSKRYQYYHKSIQKKDYLADIPISSKADDKLNFQIHVETLKKLIETISISGTHSIAITGGWGTGKTSFLNLLQQELNAQKQYEIIWFYPMKSSKSGNIQNDFFDILGNTLSKYKTGLGRRIKYYKELIGAVENKYVSFLVKLWSIRLEEEKQRINEIIKMIPKRIVIIIDDVDRLKGDEIMQVLRLVGYNAEFDNVVFLTAMDKGNVIKALGCDDNYPDKFFELEFPIPENFSNTTNLYVKETMKKFLPNISMDFMDDTSISVYTEHCINNLRDANRFLNSFVDRVGIIYGKLDVCSYYLLSLIRYKQPSLYDKIRKKNKDILEIENAAGEHWVLKEDGLNKQEETKKDKTLKQMLLDLFTTNRKSPTGHDIYRPEFFSDYFDETATKAITEAKIMLLLSAKSEEKLIQTIKQYTSNEISRQYTIELLKEYNKKQFSSSLLEDNNSELLITNYYKVLADLKIDNGLNYSEGLAKVQISRKKTAYINKQGVVAFTIECYHAGDFSEGLAFIEKDLFKNGFIDKKGKTVIPFEYEEADDFSEGLARVQKNSKWGFIDKKGKTVIPFEYEDADDFSEGLARVKKNGKYGFVDNQGRAVVPAEFDCAGAFSEGLACIGRNGKRGFIDKEGKIVIPIEYNCNDNFYEGLFRVIKNNKFGFVDRKGNTIIQYKYECAGHFSEGYVCAKFDGKCGCINKEGKVIIPFKYDKTGRFSEGVVPIKENGKCRFVNKEGTTVISTEYEEAKSFYEGLASVKKEGSWGFIDIEGNTVIPFVYEDADDFSEGLARVKKNGKYGFVDNQGRAVVLMEYEDADDFSEGLARVKKNGKYGFVNKEGNTIIPLIFDRAEPFCEGLSRVYVRGKWWSRDELWVVDKEGKFY